MPHHVILARLPRHPSPSHPLRLIFAEQGLIQSIQHTVHNGVTLNSLLAPLLKLVQHGLVKLLHEIPDCNRSVAPFAQQPLQDKLEQSR